MDIADLCDTEPESDLPMLELAQYQKRVLTALADLQLGKKAGWTNTEMEILVCMTVVLPPGDSRRNACVVLRFLTG